MKDEFVAILQKLASEQGKEPLLNVAKGKLFLAGGRGTYSRIIGSKTWKKEP